MQKRREMARKRNFVGSLFKGIHTQTMFCNCLLTSALCPVSRCLHNRMNSYLLLSLKNEIKAEMADMADMCIYTNMQPG